MKRIKRTKKDIAKDLVQARNQPTLEGVKPFIQGNPEPDNIEDLQENEQLTYKQWMFVEEYMIDGNAPKACLRAQYHTWNVVATAATLMNNTHIQAAIQTRKEALRDKYAITRERVLGEYAKIAFFNLKNLFDDRGQMIPVQDMPRDVAAALSKLRISDHVLKGGGNIITTEVKPYDKPVALDALSRYLGLFEEDNRQRVIEPLLNELLGSLPPQAALLLREKLRAAVQLRLDEGNRREDNARLKQVN